MTGLQPEHIETLIERLDDPMRRGLLFWDGDNAAAILEIDPDERKIVRAYLEYQLLLQKARDLDKDEKEAPETTD